MKEQEVTEPGIKDSATDSQAAKPQGRSCVKQLPPYLGEKRKCFLTGQSFLKGQIVCVTDSAYDPTARRVICVNTYHDVNKELTGDFFLYQGEEAAIPQNGKTSDTHRSKEIPAAYTNESFMPDGAFRF